ncbi:hypothetical protein EOPP23_15920 [Endozoicomonas sp. OPT23]|uniref:OprD family outer membrane porin n=1 Tax=Endozoicomonas sp. OPT23 TaxID=2072845 RepID=UPI00129B8544|nr:OprD family outer membrane porin [Endozoicomonas sp. OPT23]MRI34474.1 hypothetical protein [Endozoicomonas sp. OPT23]
MYRKSVLPLAIAAVVAASSAQASFSNFIDDASVKGKVRAVYMKVDGKEGKNDAGAATAGAMIDFRSGYIFDTIGFDASFYGIKKLDSAEYYNSKYDYYDSKNLLDDSGNDFSKLGQAYIKGKFGDKDANFSFKAGRARIYTGLISGSGSRSIPSSWQGIDTDFNIHGLNVGIAYVNEVLPRDRAGMKQMVTASGERIDSIVGAEVNYTFANGLSLKYMNGFAKDYVKGHQLIAKHSYKLADGSKLAVEGNYRISQENGDLWTGTGGWGGNGFKDQAETYDFNVKYSIGQAYVRAGLGYTKAENYDDKTGRHYYDFGKYSYGAWNTWTNSGLIEEFYWNGENVVALGAGYKFDNGLSIDYKFRHGSGIDLAVGGKASENEHGIDMKYKFKSVKGLSTRVRYAIYNQSGLEYKTGRQENDEQQVRVYLDYKF